MKMPPPEKMPPNGNGSSAHNGRAEEPSADARITRLEVRMENVATKSDLAEFKGEMKAEMAEFKGEIKTEIAALNGRIDSLSNELKAEMADFRAEMTDKLNTMLRWIVGSMGVMIVSILGLVAAFIFRLF